MAKKSPTQENENACANPLKIVIVGQNQMAKKAIIFNPRCKQWTCPYCAERNKSDWEWVGLRGAMELSTQGLPLEFVTLTSRGYATPAKSLYFFKQNWPKLQRRAAYHTNKQEGGLWAYFLIPERTRAGILHAHLIATTDLTERWFKDNAHATGFGYQAHVEVLEYPQATVGYVNKYLGKDVLHSGWPKGFRRVRASKHWPRPEKVDDPDWEWSKHNNESAWFEYYLLKDYGYEVTDKRTT